MNKLGLIGGVLLALTAGSTETVLSLREAGSRKAPDYLPSHLGEKIVIEGVVSARPIPFGDYSHLPLTDDKDFGLALEAPEFMFERISPGDRLEVRGVLVHRGGLPVLRPEQIRAQVRTAIPEPQNKAIAELFSTAILGRIVAVEGRVVGLSEDALGEYLTIEDRNALRYPITLPHATRWMGGGLKRFQVGDLIRVSGMTSQAAQEPPYNTKYRLVIREAASVSLLERHWLVPPQYLVILCLGLITTGLWFVKKRREHAIARRAVRCVHGFCEELLSASNPDEVIRKLRTIAPKAFHVSTVDLYRYDRGRQALLKIAPDEAAEPIPVLESEDQSGSPIALCFRNRTPLYIPDAKRSSLLRRRREARPLCTVVLLPMYAREELLGILELATKDRKRSFSTEELAALQHLANQSAIVFKLLEQQARRDQMMRSEKLAATGELIAGVAGELKRPLESILTHANKLVERGNGAASEILTESMRVSSILSHLSQVVGRRDVEASPVEMNQVLSRVSDLCAKDLSQRRLRLDLNPAAEPAWVLGATAQMELVLRNLVMLAASSAEGSQDRSVGLECQVGARRVIVRIRYGALWCDESFPAARSPGDEPDALGFSVCRGILHSLGGEVRILGAGEGTCRLEIELPAAFPAQQTLQIQAPAGNTRTLTAILLDPDVTARRRLVADWSGRGHRAIPVQNEAEALELARLIRIDAIFCAVRIGSSSWVDFFDKIRDFAPAFILMPDGMDTDASRFFPEGEGLILRKPLETGEMDRLLDKIELRMETPAPSAE